MQTSLNLSWKAYYRKIPPNQTIYPCFISPSWMKLRKWIILFFLFIHHQDDFFLQNSKRIYYQVKHLIITFDQESFVLTVIFHILFETQNLLNIQNEKSILTLSSCSVGWLFSDRPGPSTSNLHKYMFQPAGASLTRV